MTLGGDQLSSGFTYLRENKSSSFTIGLYLGLASFGIYSAKHIVFLFKNSPPICIDICIINILSHL